MNTYINSFGLIVLVFNSVLVLVLSRKYLVVPMFLLSCYMTYGQIVLIADLHFTFFRILIFIYWIRFILRKEYNIGTLNIVDKIFVLWVFSAVIMYTILWGTMGAFFYRMGFAYDAIGLYFMFRFTIRNIDDMVRSIQILSVIIGPLAILMLIEFIIQRNIFSIFGGVPEMSWARYGKIRSQGPFRYPIMAGTFGATILPFFIALWFNKEKYKKYAFIGIISSTIITITASSSGPVMAYIFGILAIIMWPFRAHMRVFRWGIGIFIIGLHLVMKAPVWYLMARISDLIGGTGWHRSYLIDQAILHIDEWWLFGTNNTSDWMPYVLASEPNMADITNAYLLEGVRGGIVTMVLFISMIIVCFKKIGNVLKYNDVITINDKYFIWSMGAALFSHAMTFFSISYFDQIIVFWYLLISMISTVSKWNSENNNYTLSVDNANIAIA